MKELFVSYLTILFQMFQYDIDILSRKWVIVTIVPAIFYLIFFFVKWAVLTTPIWLPLSLIFSGFKAFPRK